MHGDARDDTSTLQRIADVLGLPVEVLLASAVGDDPAAPSQAELQALMTAFALVTDPQARRRILDAVETEARRGEAASGRDGPLDL